MGKKSVGTLEFSGITKRFDDLTVINKVNLEIKKGEFFSLIGPSGCGKTTLLRLVAGFETLDEGKIFLDGKDISSLPPHKRPVNTVFQNYALFPHLTVFENIAFGLRMSRQSESFIKTQVGEMLELIQLSHIQNKYSHQISGGQKQRVAIARALVNRPDVLLLDEPLAALDLKLRQRMLLELDRIHDEVGITFLFVTHDQSEAMAVSDTIALLNKGKVEQVGTPVELYESPTSSFVAAFIGDTNFLDGTVSKTVDRDYSLLKVQHFPDILCFNDKQHAVGDLVHLSVRPEKIQIVREKPELKAFCNVFEGVVEDIIYKGDHTHYWIRAFDHRIAVIAQHTRFLDRQPLAWGDKVWIYWHADDGFMLERYNAKDELTSLEDTEGDS